MSLPASLDLSAHLSAHKYFFVCTLTVAAWDTLVLSPRTWRLMKTQGWPALKLLFSFLRVFMPVEFTIVAVAFFDTQWSQATCQKFYLFEPICTAILLAATSAVHIIRIHAIYDKKRPVLYLMGGLYALQVIVTGIACAFYLSVPLREGQGCIAGPRYNWVGIYWIAPTLLYTASFGLALMRSLNSLKDKPLSPWKLMLRDGLNLYGAIWLVNMTNMLFWFITTPTDDQDTIKTIVTSMAAVLTTSMTLRIILSVRGTLEYGGSFALSSALTGSSRSTHVISTRSGLQTQLSMHNATHTYTLDHMHSKPEGEYDIDITSSVNETKGRLYEANPKETPLGVKVTVDQEVGYDDDTPFHAK
ncbi:hypothetical protein M378DRAFT_159004 [Amanita muscaria Koide BX008]|uniref:Uncharacterized protein n=1 Tax=Amanita muscaria (strain Koide BX008) TaxID=946122 RepID=A0A0C2XED6_AMAMK|nr:hypothetical protein M378DRAFT_159004 [Amanita muscaria Koide BX008]